MGRSWEELVRERILEPLEMRSTHFALPAAGNVTQSYHENARRELKLTQRLAAEATAPSGGAIHSTVEDMARWMAFNLNGGQVMGRALIGPQTLKNIHSPQIVIPAEATTGKRPLTYALGWVLDPYHGSPRILHGGYLHDVHSEVSLFPEECLGIVCFINFGPPMLALLITEQVFDIVMDLKPVHTLEEKLAEYERQVAEIRERNATVPRVAGTSPSHLLSNYVGVYENSGYGRIEIDRQDDQLFLRRDALTLPLQHWHYDAWIAEESEDFCVHLPHAFDRASRILFETNADGLIAAFSIGLEPAVPPIRFQRRP